MKRASLTARLRVLEAAQASPRAGVFAWQGGQWAALTPGASLPAGVPSLPDLVEGMGEAGNAGPYAGRAADRREDHSKDFGRHFMGGLMTAKRKGRGSMLARLEDLEAKEAARVEEVRAWNWSKIEAAYARLSGADRAALRGVGLLGGEPDALEDLTRQCAGMSEDHGPRVDVEHAAKEEAQAWEALALDVPDGVRLILPPAGRVPAFVSYFEEMGAAYDALACAVPLSPVLHRLARLCAALERFTARLCEVLGKA